MVSLLWSSSELSVLILSTAALALIVTVLSQAQAILVPLALAIMLTFVLIPPVELLERYTPRLMAVIVILLCTLTIVGSITYILYYQFNDLASQFPRYSVSIKEKFAALRATRNSALESIVKTVDEVSHELDQQEQQRAQASGETGERKNLEVNRQVQSVIVVPSEPTDIERLWIMAEPMFEPLMTAIIVIVLVAFMLVQREELRNRFIRLVGEGRLSLTTKIMDEVGQKISSFLFTQLIINAGFGSIVGLGLWCIGIPYAVLWGVMAALLRFVPFVGSFISMLLPLALAFVIFPGWWHLAATLGLFLVLDVVTAHIVEPLLIGHKIGVSSLALLVMALFWTWLWGPFGLLLTTPITVCLVVLGKYVPQCAFFSVLLGDEPALAAEASVYQRLLANDEEEASEIVARQLQKTPLVEVYDSVLIPTLLQATQDYRAGEISEAEQAFVLQAIQDLVEELGEEQQPENKAACVEAQTGDKTTPLVNLLLIPARSKSSHIVLDMLRFRLDQTTCMMRTLSISTLASEVLITIEKERPDLVIITVMPPKGNSQARYLCKRLRAQFPNLRILVLRPGIDDDTTTEESETVIQSFIDAGADKVATQLTQALLLLPQMVYPSVIRITGETKEPFLAPPIANSVAQPKAAQQTSP